MNAFLLPVAAVAVWGGILLRPGGDPPPWVAIAGGLACLLGSAALAWRPAPLPDALVTARLLRDPPSVEAVVPARSRPGPAPPWAVASLGLAGLIALGAGLEGARLARLGSTPLGELAPARVEVVATLRTDPSQGRFGWSAVADVREVRTDGGALSLREAVWVRGSAEEIPAAARGDLVRLDGTLLAPSEGFRDFLWSHGIAVELRAEGLERLGPSPNPFLRAALAVRRTLSRSIRRLFPEREAGLLLGLALGEDSGLHPELERDFRATGLSHLLVVSGGNVAMVLAPALAIALALRASARTRLAIGVGTVAFFVAMTGAEPSVMRAGLMAGIGLVGVFLGRPRSTASTLGAAVLVLLLLDPSLARAVGFQLSVGATAGMVALATPFAKRLWFLPRPVAAAAGATLAAQAAVSPVLLFYFHEVPLVTIVANVLAFPAVSPALLLGLGAAALGAPFPGLGRVVAGAANLPLGYLEAVADRLARAPVGWITSSGGTATLIVGTAAVIGLAWWLRSERRAPKPVRAAAPLVLLLFLWSSAMRAGPPSAVTIHFLDVGQGDAALVVSPEGATALIDGGPDPAVVATKLSALGVRRIDVLVASHAHADHVAGLPAVVARFPVGVVLEPGCPDDSADYLEFLQAVDDEDLRVEHPRAGDVLEVGDLRLEVLAPNECFAGTSSDANNDSLVIRLVHGDDVVLFPGDAEQPSQQMLLEEGALLDCDVLKVPHHGGDTSLDQFLVAARAEVAVVSVGEGNDYGHPVPEVLDALRASGAAVLRTDVAGDVTVILGEEGPLVASAA